MKNSLIVVTCYILLFLTSHTASGLTCPLAFETPINVLSQTVNYFRVQKLKYDIQFHKRNLIAMVEPPFSVITIARGKGHLDILLRAPENPILTIEQQKELKTKIANFLLTNYQKLYHEHGKRIEEWIYINGTSAIRDKALAAAKNFSRLADSYIHVLTRLHQILLDLSAKEGIGFSLETLAYFDALPLKEKVELVGPSGEPPKLNSPKAQALVESWGKSVRLYAGRKEVQEKLNEYYQRFWNIRPLKEYISNELGLNGGLGYYNQSIMRLLMSRQSDDKTSYQTPLVQQLYILVEHRLRNALTTPDKGRSIEESRLKEPSTIAILSILGEIGRNPSMLGRRWWIPQSTPWNELKDLVNQSFDPQIRAYLSSLLPTISAYLDPLSSSSKDSKKEVPSIDIFAGSNHNLSSFIQN